jgi:hypothetical protein
MQLIQGDHMKAFKDVQREILAQIGDDLDLTDAARGMLPLVLASRERNAGSLALAERLVAAPVNAPRERS